MLLVNIRYSCDLYWACATYTNIYSCVYVIFYWVKTPCSGINLTENIYSPVRIMEMYTFTIFLIATVSFICSAETSLCINLRQMCCLTCIYATWMTSTYQMSTPSVPIAVSISEHWAQCDGLSCVRIMPNKYEVWSLWGNTHWTLMDYTIIVVLRPLKMTFIVMAVPFIDHPSWDQCLASTLCFSCQNLVGH